jgi:hypothetical protein
MNEQFSRALLERLDPPLATDADVVVLAALICTPPFVPFPLLRDVRSQCLPGSLLDLEARLCESNLVESIASDGFVLHVSSATAIRRALRGVVLAADLDIDLTGLRSAMKPGLEHLSPLLRLEERITWAYATTEDVAALAEEELAAVVYGVVRERRLRMLEWASGAMTRLPEEVLHTPSAWLLSQLCRGVGLPHPVLDRPDDELSYAVFREASAVIPQTVIGIARDGVNLSVGPVSRERPIGVRVPATVPATLRVVWDGRPGGVELSEIDSTVQTVPTGRSAVELIGLDGMVVRLAPMTGGTPPEQAEVSQVFDRLQRAQASRHTMRADVLAMDVGPVGHLVRLRDEPTIQAFLPSRLSAFPRLPKGALGELLAGTILVQIERVDRENQRVTVRRVRSTLSRGSLRVGQRCRGRVVAKLRHGLLISLNEAAGMSQPDYEPLLGFIPTSGLLPVQGWSADFRSARSYPVNVGREIEALINSITPNNRQIRLAMARHGASLPEGVRPGDRLIGIVAERFYHGIRFSLIGRAGPSAGSSPLPAGLTGIVMITELSWEGRWYFGGGDARNYPLQLGDRSELLVTGPNEATGEINLSIKRLMRDPAPAALKQLRPGTEGYGVVLRRRGQHWRIRLEPWSVTIDMTAGRDFHDQLPHGTQVYVRIEEVDLIGRKIRSSLKRIVSSPEEEARDE